MTILEAVEFHFLLTCMENTSLCIFTTCIKMSLFTASRSVFQYKISLHPLKSVFCSLETLLSKTCSKKIHLNETFGPGPKQPFAGEIILPTILQLIVIAEKLVMNISPQNKISLVKEYNTCLTMLVKKNTAVGWMHLLLY